MNVNNPYNLIYKLLGWWRLKTQKNFGFIPEQPFNTLGEVIPWEVLQKNMQWDLYLPDYEYQRLAWGDTMSCVTFSLLNVLETLLKRKYNEKWDFSDRFTAKMSGTTRQGNLMYNVLESFKDDGFLSWLMYYNDGKNWDEYYQPISGNLTLLAKDNIEKTFEVKGEWITNPTIENLLLGLKKSPLWSAIYAYGEKVDGIYQRIEGYSPNHCIEIYGVVWKDPNLIMNTIAEMIANLKSWKVYDHYLGGEKRLLAPDYLIGYAQCLFIRKLTS